MSAGHEERFRRLFTEEAAGRLGRLSEAALDLEGAASRGDPADPALVEAMLREAHSLKGGAAVVGLEPLARAAHALEDVVEALRADAPASATLVDGLLSGIDGLRGLLAAVREGREHAGDAHALVEALRAGPSAAPPARPRPGPSRVRVGWVAVPPSEPGALRVPRARLDQLTTLVAESAAAHLRVGRALAELDVDAAALPEFRRLSQLLADLQERTMRVRMVPVASALEPLRRAVRDVARGLGKQVRWELRGGTTELDRGVLEQLADPLLHLVRNAVDHGLEDPDERRAVGKEPEGLVCLAASQRGSEVVLDLTDDGRGIDLAGVRSRAEEVGHDTAGLGDTQVLELVFSSGLSTAPAVTDFSGRGVGLDVVVAALRGVRGHVEVRTSPGRGTRFRMVVPLTLAVLPCLVVEAGGQRFALPLPAVDRIVPVSDHPPVPAARLRDVLGLTAASATNERLRGAATVVLRDGTAVAAFAVDAVVGQRDVVVKGLSRLLPRLDLVSGASVEADGAVLVVLDPAGLVARASVHGGGRGQE